jgi:hypothetical protein
VVSGKGCRADNGERLHQRRRPSEKDHHGAGGRRGDYQLKGPWEQVCFGEFDGMRGKRALGKIIGEQLRLCL